MKLTLEKVQAVLKKHEASLQNFEIESLAVFGSVARGQAKTGSDVDFLVEFKKPVGLFEFLDFKYFLEDLLKTEIDLATKRSLHPMLRETILKEAIRVA